MSVKHALLALLEDAPRYGYELRAEFEERTGASWPLNVGQVYTTLSRLERDGLVEAGGTDAEGRSLYQLTEAGKVEVKGWFDTPVERTQAQRDELAIKLAVAVAVPSVDVGKVVQQQRSATMQALQGYRRQARSGAADDLAAGLVLDRLVFAAEAEIRWLDHCESRLRRAAVQSTAPDPIEGGAR